MTKIQAYRAMFEFLHDRYSRLPSDGLGQLLGEMALLEDGVPADSAIVAEWDKLSRSRFRTEGDSLGTRVADDEAYTREHFAGMMQRQGRRD